MCGYLPCSENACLNKDHFLSGIMATAQGQSTTGAMGSEATTASPTTGGDQGVSRDALSCMGSGGGALVRFVSNADFTEKPQCFPWQDLKSVGQKFTLLFPFLWALLCCFQSLPRAARRLYSPTVCRGVTGLVSRGAAV